MHVPNGTGPGVRRSKRYKKLQNTNKLLSEQIPTIPPCIREYVLMEIVCFKMYKKQTYSSHGTEIYSWPESESKLWRYMHLYIIKQQGRFFVPLKLKDPSTISFVCLSTFVNVCCHHGIYATDFCYKVCTMRDRYSIFGLPNLLMMSFNLTH